MPRRPSEEASPLTCRAVHPAHGRTWDVRLHVRSAFTWEPGTWVREEDRSTMEQAVISAVTSDTSEAKVTVTGEIIEPGKGPKIRIHKFKNKTGYHKRQGHRQPLTRVKVTGISTGK